MVSVCFGFPLNFVLLRSELAGALAGRSGAAKGGQHVRLTVVLLAIVASLAVVLQDLGKVQAVSGSILGSFIVFVAPACMKRARRRRRGEQAGGWRSALVEALLIASGLFLGSVGLLVSLRGA